MLKLTKSIFILFFFVGFGFSEARSEEFGDSLIPLFEAEGFVVEIQPGTLYTSFADETKNRVILNEKINPEKVFIIKNDKINKGSFNGLIYGGNISPLVIMEKEGGIGQTSSGRLIETLDRLFIIETFSVGTAIYVIYNSKIDGVNAYHVTMSRISYHNRESFQTIASGRAYPVMIGEELLEDVDKLLEVN